MSVMYLHALLYRSIAGHRVLNVWRARNSFTVSCTIKSDESCTLLCEDVYVERLKLAQSGFHRRLPLHDKMGGSRAEVTFLRNSCVGQNGGPNN